MPDRSAPDDGAERGEDGQVPSPPAVDQLRRLSIIGLVVLIGLAGLWWVLPGRDAPPSDTVVEDGSERVQPLDWISFEQPQGAWRYDRINATTPLGWLGDRSVAGDLANLQVSVAPAGQGLAEVRADYRESVQEAGTVTRFDESDTRVPGTDSAIVLVASGTDDGIVFDIVVLLMGVEDRVVTLVMGSAGGPSLADLRATVDSVVIDREALLEQLG